MILKAVSKYFPIRSMMFEPSFAIHRTAVLYEDDSIRKGCLLASAKYEYPKLTA